MNRDEAYQKAQAIVIKHVEHEVSDVQAVQLIAEALLEAYRAGAASGRATPFLLDD